MESVSANHVGFRYRVTDPDDDNALLSLCETLDETFVALRKITANRRHQRSGGRNPGPLQVWEQRQTAVAEPAVFIPMWHPVPRITTTTTTTAVNGDND